VSNFAQTRPSHGNLVQAPSHQLRRLGTESIGEGFSHQDEWFPMRIAQIAPLIESVPPRYYGGTERVVSYLTEDLVAQGHEVTLFASGDSITAANLVTCCTQALRLDAAVSDVVPYYMLMLDKVRSHAAQFDVLHFHIEYLAPLRGAVPPRRKHSTAYLR
jgi:glycosyltransferase involved in cell wall biosynthesis